MEPRGVLVVEDTAARTALTRSGRVGAFEHIANRPIVHHVLDALEAAGVQEVVVASSAELARDVRACIEAREARGRAALTYVSQQRAPLDVASALSLAAPIVRGAPCVAHLAAGLLGVPLAPFVDQVLGGSPNVVVIRRQADAAEVEPRDPQSMLRIVRPELEAGLSAAAGVWLFGPDAVHHAAAARRADGEIDSAMLGERIANAGGSLRAISVHDLRLYTGDPRDLLELNRIALDRLQTEPPRPNNNNSIEGRVQIHERASVTSSVIVGPAVIGPNARVADAYIGPYTSIGSGARIEGAEIERSIIGQGASVMHIGGRLMASVVGRDARIFRDFSLPRALRLQVGEGTQVAFY